MQAVLNGLRCKQTVKRVAMMKRRSRYNKRIFDADRQQGEIIYLQLLTDFRERRIQSQLAKTDFDGHFPNAGNAYIIYCIAAFNSIFCR